MLLRSSKKGKRPDHGSSVRAPLESLISLDILLLLALFSSQLVFFIFLAFHRIVDSDEGFYLYASKLLAANGEFIYRDFFYPQMPLLPFVYGGWMKLFGFDWETARALSAIGAAVTGTLIFHHFRSSAGRVLLPAVALLLYAFNLSVLLFFLAAKTYVLSTVLLLASVLVGGIGNSKHARWGALLSGFLFGLSVQARLIFIVAAPVMALWVWNRNVDRPGRLPAAFCGGFLVASIPSLLFLIIAPKQFIFDNLIYHSIRNPFGLIAQFDQKLSVVKQLFFGASGWKPTQFSLLCAGTMTGLFFWKKLTPTARVCVALSVALGGASILPTPAFGQYFCVLIPFLIISFVSSIDAIMGSSGNSTHRVAIGTAVLVFSLIYATWSISRIDRLFIGAEMAPGVDPDTVPLDWKIPTIEKVATLVEENTRPEDLVLSVWPGYLLTADRRVYPGMENQFSLDSAMRITPEKASEYKMLRANEIPQLVADPATGSVIIGNWSHGKEGTFRQLLEDESYKSVGRISRTEVFVRNRKALFKDMDEVAFSPE